MRRTFWKHYALGAAALALGLISAPASAWCDFVTGGGFIMTTAEGRHGLAMANFGVHGGCKNGAFWGHVNYVDHGYSPPGHFRSTTITNYSGNFDDATMKNPKRGGTREICGRGVWSLYPLPVAFRVEVTDTGPEPGRNNDAFRIRLGIIGGAVIYSTYGDDGTLRGGNIQLHKPNPSTTEFPPEGDCEV